MCVYLAPRWRRRSWLILTTFVLVLALLLTAADGHVLRRQDSGSGSAVGEQDVGVVTTYTQQSTMVVATQDSGSYSVSDEKSVSFDRLVKITNESSNESASMDNEIQIPETKSSNGDGSSGESNSTNTGDTKQVDGDNHTDRSFNDRLNDDSAENNADSKSSVDQTISTKGTTIKTTTLSSTPTFATSAQAPRPHPGTFDARPMSSSSSSSREQSVEGQSYEESGSINSAKTLENRTKSASVTTSSTSLDETLVVVIFAVVGAIAALLMVASRKVLKETGDDKDLEDSSFF